MPQSTASGTEPPYAEGRAFSQLYDNTHLQVFRYIYGLLGGPRQEVEDLTAETFFRAWKARTSFTGNERGALAWLFTIARNLVIDSRRRDVSRGIPDALDEMMVPSAEADPESETEYREQQRILWNQIHDLPEQQREMIVLRYMLGWRVKDIAQHMDMNENTVSVNLRRILKRLGRDWPGG